MGLKSRFFCIVYLFCHISILSSFAQAAQEVPAAESFQTIKTPHFDIIHSIKYRELGAFYAQKMENLYKYLSRTFTVLPTKTIVVINDKTDITNGYATRVPYPHIMIYPVLPGSADIFFDYGDWADELLGHEFTHILNFEPATGIVKPLRSIFGSIVAPNLLLPNWWKEGLAVHMESTIPSLGKTFGRTRSVYQDSIIRSLIQDDKWFANDVSIANENAPYWPEGMRPYLFGSLFWAEVAENKKADVINKMNLSHAGKIPYFIDSTAKEYLGSTYSDVYFSAMKHTAEKAEEQIYQLERLAFSESQRMTVKDHLYSSAPVFSPDQNKLAFSAVDEGKNRKLIVLERNLDGRFPLYTETNKETSINGKDELRGNSKIIAEDNWQLDPIPFSDQALHPKDQLPTGSFLKFVWFKDSSQILYDKIDSYSSLEKYSDLYIYNFKNKKNEQITSGLRAREPDLNPDNSKAVFVKLEAGKTHLAEINLASKEVKILRSGQIHERIMGPIYLDPNRILFSLRERTGGYEGLYILDLTTQKTTEILHQFPQARFTKLTQEGLLFSSSYNGVNNIYLANSSMTDATPLTHVSSSVLSPAWDEKNNQLWGTLMTSDGPQVAEFKKLNNPIKKEKLPFVTPLFSDRFPYPAGNSIDDVNFKSTSEDYNAFSYLKPQFWIPYIATSSTDNGLTFSAQTFNFDPLRKHYYRVSLSYNTYTQQPSVYGIYENNQWPWTWNLAGFEKTSYLGSLNNTYKDHMTSLNIEPDVFKLSKYLNLNIGVKKNTRDMSQTFQNHWGPFATISYSTISSGGRQISPESGFGAYLGIDKWINIENTISQDQLIWGGTFYASQWLPKHHVFMAKLKSFVIPKTVSFTNGVVTDGSEPYQDYNQPFYVIRGTRMGQFLARKIHNTSFEYRFPIQDFYRGYGTYPIFFDRVHSALISDFLIMEGLGFNDKTLKFQRMPDQYFFGTLGAEVRFEIKLGYLLPLTFVTGVYIPTSNDLNIKSSFGMNFQMSTVLD